MKVGITGSHGLIGSALARKFPYCYTYLRPDLDYLFLFGSPSSDYLFHRDMDYCFSETIGSFLHAIRFCRDNNIKLIYPSSATVYNKNTPYARCKAILEEIHESYGGDVLGLRIFAGYGNEEHKGDYASVVYQFTKAILKGDKPVIYGDGTQSRDFIHVDDIVDNIVRLKDQTGIVDVGTGINTSFNKLVAKIGNIVGEEVEPLYIDKPDRYVNSTKCNTPVEYKVSLTEGIKRIIHETTLG